MTLVPDTIQVRVDQLSCPDIGAFGLWISDVAVNDLLSTDSPFVLIVGNIAFAPPRPYLRGEEYPALVKVWDNNDDAIFDAL